MHRVKRPAAGSNEFGFSQAQNRTSHDNPGEEAVVNSRKNSRGKSNFQLNAVAGPLGEEYQEQD